MTIRDALNFAKEKISTVNIDSIELFNSANIDATLLVSYSLKMSRESIYANFNKVLTSTEINTLNKVLKRRIKGEPIAYILGKKEFYGVDFFVNKNVLIPRCDTEVIVEKSIELIKEKNYKSALDLCTGSGCIAAIIKQSFPNLEVLATDIKNGALKIANKNWKNLNLNINSKKSNLFKNISSKFDLIVTNPPYIEKTYMKKIQKYLFEPKIALYGKSDDGLNIIFKIIVDAKKHLNENGVLLIEAGENQLEIIKKNMVENNYNCVTIIKDLSNKNRVVYGYYNK